MNELKKEEIECLWHEFDKNSISENLLRSYHIIFKMAARYAVTIDTLDKIIKRLKFN